jgi:ribonuclease BN (tRNA processing enzyme)
MWNVAPSDAVRIRFLGTGDAFGSGGRLQTCILAESTSGSCLIDCGASSLIALKQAGVAPNDIDTILITHLHGDHFGGLPFFILDEQFSNRTDPLIIAGPPGIMSRNTEAMEVLFPGSSGARRKFEVKYQELTDGVAASVGRVQVTAFEVVHPSGAPSYALRVELGGRVITYSGDTEWTDRLVPAASGADIFVCEATSYDERVPLHLAYATIMEHRSELDCKRIILTHMNSDMLSRVPELAIEAAHDGLEIEL